jgi:hypothetical protein
MKFVDFCLCSVFTRLIYDFSGVSLKCSCCWCTNDGYLYLLGTLHEPRHNAYSLASEKALKLH